MSAMGDGLEIVSAPWRERLARLMEQQPSAASSPYRCEDCQDTGWKSADGEAPRVTRCDCLPKQLHADGVPFEFRSATLANYESRPGNETASMRARAFLTGTRDLLLVGGVGAGKTRLACSVLNAQPSAGLFARVAILLHELQPGGDAETRRALETRLCTMPVLVLDDVGAERDTATDFTRRTLMMIYEARGDRGLRTIWTSNKDLRQLAEMQADDRLTSRIAGRADVVLVGCADQRLARRRLASVG